MATIPTSTRSSLSHKLNTRAREQWPQITHVDTRFRGSFAYVSAQLPDDDDLPLMRLRYGGSASTWGFAIYRASHNDYEDSYLPTGHTTSTPEDALDTACNLYLNHPTTQTQPPTN